MIRKILVAAGSAALFLTCVYASTLPLRSPRHSQWPEFLFAGEGAPQYNWEVQDREFAYRTGNHVNVSYFFSVPQGTELYTDQLAVEGDFQLQGKTVHVEQHGSDRYMRVDLTLQTFIYKTPAWQINARVPYRTADGTVKQLVLMPIDVSSSNTFDGKKNQHPKEAKVELISNAGHLAVTACLILSGSVGLIFSMVLLRGKRKTKKKDVPAEAAANSGVPPAWQPILSGWRAITGGAAREEDFAAVAAAIRSLYTEVLTAPEIRAGALPDREALVTFLSVCEKPLWSDDPVSAEEIKAADGALDQLCKTANVTRENAA